MSSTPERGTGAELKSFRDQWKRELNQSKPSSSPVEETPAKECKEERTIDVEVPFPFQFTDSLLQTWQDAPSATKSKSAGKSSQSDSGSVEAAPAKKPRLSLVDVYLEDLNDIDDIPFFDITLPREVALKILSYLDVVELCHCSQVSQAWHSLADDNVLWERMYRKWRHTFTFCENLEASSHWKETVGECFVKTRLLRSHWREHKCHVTYYHHARGGILTSTHVKGELLMAGYSNGQVKVWNIHTDESQTLQPCSESLQLVDEAADDILSTSENSVTCVQIGNQGKVIAGYNHGYIQLWDCDQPDDVHCTEYPGRKVTSICVGDAANIAYVQVSGPGSLCEIKALDLTDSRLTHVDGVVIRERDSSWTLPKVIFSPLRTESGSDSSALLFLKRDSLMIHSVSVRDGTAAPTAAVSAVESFYGTHFTCLTTSRRHVSLGMTSHLGVQAEYKVRCYDPSTLRHSFDLRGHTSQVTCVDSSYEGFLLTTGCHDRRVRLFDSRLPSAVVRTYTGHAGSVECVQADDWKIISGDTEGYILVWDQRMSAKLWESQSRHPVKLLRFTADRLIAANIPNKCYVDDLDSDKMTHIRYRGRLQVSDFSVGHSDSNVPSICSSSYDAPEASTYNLSLITPYDVI